MTTSTTTRSYYERVDVDVDGAHTFKCPTIV